MGLLSCDTTSPRRSCDVEDVILCRRGGRATGFLPGYFNTHGWSRSQHLVHGGRRSTISHRTLWTVQATHGFRFLRSGIVYFGLLTFFGVGAFELPVGVLTSASELTRSDATFESTTEVNCAPAAWSQEADSEPPFPSSSSRISCAGPLATVEALGRSAVTLGECRAQA